MRAGDTLYSVARKHGITPMDLLAVNPDVSAHNARVGTVVRIPYVGMSAKAVSAAMSPAGKPVEATPDYAMPGYTAPNNGASGEASPDYAMPYEAAPSLALHDQMRTLWEQHVWWTRELMISILASLPDEAEVTSRLLENPDQIAALFRPAFGDQAAQTISRLLTEHLVIAAEIMKAAKENDTEAVADANQRWNENADAIAAALASLGPQFPEEEMRQMLYRHLDLTREELAARLAGDYERDINAIDAIEQQALMMADVFSQGIAQAGRAQFRDPPAGRMTARPSLPAVPSALDQLESGAEDIIDLINNKDWARAQSTVDAMEQSLADLQPSFQAANVPQSLVNEIRTRLTMLETQVKAQNAYEAKVQANAITRVIPDIFDHYRVAVPTDLGRLDYLGRELLLNVEKGDWTAARNTAAEVQRVWSRLKPMLNATAQKSAADFESTVNALSSDARNMDRTATTRDANALLDKVDVLEQAYTG